MNAPLKPERTPRPPPADEPQPQDMTLAMFKSAVRLADRAVICDIELHGTRVHNMAGGRWYDITALLDPREQPAEHVDMNREAIGYALARGFIECHGGTFYSGLVRIARYPAD